MSNCCQMSDCRQMSNCCRNVKLLTSSPLLGHLARPLLSVALHPLDAGGIVGVVEPHHLVGRYDGLVEVRIPRRRVQRVRFPVLVQVVGRRLRQQPVDGLAFRQDVQRGEISGGPAADGPGGVQRGEETAGAARAGRPERLKGAEIVMILRRKQPY